MAEARKLAQMGLARLQRKKWADAEPSLRDCLAIREHNPDRTASAYLWTIEEFPDQVREAAAAPSVATAGRDRVAAEAVWGNAPG